MSNTSKEYFYSEIFDSIQGEGHYTGRPTAWLRFFLCNLQCNGFGQKDPTNPDTYILPYEDFDENKIDVVEDLPVWEYGCDSSYSWAKKFKKFQLKGTSEELAQRVQKAFTNEYNEGHWLNRHMCFTGGEPMMKHAQEASVGMMKHWIDNRNFPRYVTYETNGTQPLTQEFIDFYSEYRDVWGGELFFSVSPKLWATAGEKAKRAIKPEVIQSYHQLLGPGQLKFVVNGTTESWLEVEDIERQFRFLDVDWPVWIMPVGATQEGQEKVAADVAKEAFERGYNVSARVHTYLWGNIIGV